MTIKGEIERDVRTRQRGVRIKAGDQFWRGVELVKVDKVSASNVTYTVMDTGSESTIERRDFLSVALTKVPLPDGDEAPLLDRAWAVLSTAALPKNYRVTAGRSLLRSAQSDEDRRKIRGWLYAIRMDREPKR